jgi:hypothetical protein
VGKLFDCHVILARIKHGTKLTHNRMIRQRMGKKELAKRVVSLVVSCTIFCLACKVALHLVSRDI